MSIANLPIIFWQITGTLAALLIVGLTFWAFGPKKTEEEREAERIEEWKGVDRRPGE